MTTLFEEAMKYREIARELHQVLGSSVPCTCVETPEYQKFVADGMKARESMSREERLLHFIFEDFQGEKLQHECERCVVMYKYEVAIGDDAVDLEIINRLNNAPHGGNNGELPTHD